MSCLLMDRTDAEADIMWLWVLGETLSTYVGRYAGLWWKK